VRENGEEVGKMRKFKLEILKLKNTGMKEEVQRNSLR
jgi:hypothetical protein